MAVPEPLRGRFEGVGIVCGLCPAVALKHVALREADAELGEVIVDLRVRLHVGLADRLDPDVGERFVVAAHEANHKAVHLLVERLGDLRALVAFEHVALFALERRAQAFALGNGREVRSTVERRDRTVHALDELRHGGRAGVEVDGRVVRVLVNGARPGA